MDFIKYTFNEDSWNIFIIEDSDETIADENSAAQVMFSNKEIYFRKGHLNLESVMHEIWHVYFSYCYLSDTTSLTMDDIEEISAALFCDKGIKMINRAKEIYEKLLTLRTENEKEVK